MPDIPYCVYLNKLSDPRWKPLPDGYHITYQPTGNGNSYLAHTDEIGRSCRHFSKLVNSVFVGREYKTYHAARRAILEHCKGCTKEYFPNAPFNIIILPPMEF